MSRVRLLCWRGSILACLLLAAPVAVRAGGLSFVEFEQALLPGVNGLAGASGVAVSPNGLNVYTVGTQDDAITVWDRNPATSAVTQVEVEEDGVAAPRS